jgi:hypothetical protein
MENKKCSKPPTSFESATRWIMSILNVDSMNKTNYGKQR